MEFDVWFSLAPREEGTGEGSTVAYHVGVAVGGADVAKVYVLKFFVLVSFYCGCQ